MTATANLLAFLGLTATLLLVWRQSWPARLRLFAVQSALLAVLATAIGVLAGKWALLGVGAVFLVVKAWVIPRVLWRIGAGAPVRPIAPGHSSGIALLVAGVLIMEGVVAQVRREHASTEEARLRELRG